MYNKEKENTKRIQKGRGTQPNREEMEKRREEKELEKRRGARE